MLNNLEEFEWKLVDDIIVIGFMLKIYIYN